MSNRNQAPLAGAEDEKSHTRNPEMGVAQVEKAGGITTMGHYDVRLSPNYRDENNNNNTSALSSEQANAATRIANASFQAVTNTNLNANPPGAVGGCLCSHCSTPGHGHPECPNGPANIVMSWGM